MANTFSTQDFVSTVAHDLRAPVRHLSQFSSMLMDTLDQPSEEQRQYCLYIEQSVRRSNLLLDALSELASIHSREIQPQDVAMDTLAKSIAKDLESKYGATPDLTVNSSPKLSGVDFSHSYTLLYALIDNAFKFRSQSRELLITVNLQHTSGRQLLTVADNGIGIDPYFLPQCTRIFSKGDGTTEGVGIGLTFVEHIVNRYGGSLRLAGGSCSAGAGTSVLLDLPFVTNAL